MGSGGNSLLQRLGVGTFTHVFNKQNKKNIYTCIFKQNKTRTLHVFSTYVSDNFIRFSQTIILKTNIFLYLLKWFSYTMGALHLMKKPSKSNSTKWAKHVWCLMFDVWSTHNSDTFSKNKQKELYLNY